MLPPYAELHCLSNFSFQRGASHAEELIERAIEQGYAALAITDECSLAGVVRAHLALRAARAEAGERSAAQRFRLIVGAEFRLLDGLRIVLLAQNRAGYGNLAALITLARRRAAKGRYELRRGDLDGIDLAGTQGAVPDCLLLWCADAGSSEADARWLAGRFAGRAWIAAELHAGPDDAGRVAALRRLSAVAGLPVVAAGDVHMHRKSRRRTC
jgi:error-prone DNA polymerase